MQNAKIYREKTSVDDVQKMKFLICDENIKISTKKA